MAKSPLARAQALVLLQEMARTAPWEEHGLQQVYIRARRGDGRELTDLIRHATDDITELSRDDLARVMLHVRELSASLEAYENRTVAEAKGSPEQRSVEDAVRLTKFARMTQELNLSEAIDAKRDEEDAEPPASSVRDYIEGFLSEKIVQGYTAGTVHQSRATFRLWMEFMGELPVAQVQKKHADSFRDLLLKLPSSHGKSSSKGKAATGPESVELADRLTEGGKPVTRLSLKTVKRHFSTMQQMWKWLSGRADITGNPFAGYKFPKRVNKRGSRDDWADTDLLKLLTSDHMKKAAIERSRDFWIVAVGMWTGMRLEEICRLRPKQDVAEIDGVAVFDIKDQIEPTVWLTKTEAGERVFPIPRILIEAGILELPDARINEERLVPGTRYSGPGSKLGTEFSRKFSNLKKNSGVTRKTVFHSFRHSVSTILRNEDTRIRAEWIDAVLGHEASDRNKSEGSTTYSKRVGARNMIKTVEAIRYPETVEAAFRELLVQQQAG